MIEPRQVVALAPRGHFGTKQTVNCGDFPRFRVAARFLPTSGSVPTRTERTHVLIVSRNDETAQHLAHYFESRGLSAQVSLSLELEQGPKTPTALVVFPDEFPQGEVERGILQLVQCHPRAVFVVVTGDTQRYAGLDERLDDASSRRLTVLPRPAFSWTILDHVIVPRATLDSTRGF